MSMPPRSRTGSGPLIAGTLILLAIGIGVVVLLASGITPQRLWDSFFPIENQTPVTDRSLAIKALYDFVFYIAAAIFVIVEAVLIYTAFRYRRKPTDAELPPQTHGNNLVEVVWTVIPTIIVAVLFVLSWQTLNTVDAKATTTVHITAVAARFQWSFDYLAADGKTVLFTQNLPKGDEGGMFVPVGEPVQVDLRSTDVIHAFYVPKFLFKRDVVPGKLNTFDFTVEEAGVYRGQCAELCGTYHGSMLFEVHAVDRATFDAWLQKQIDLANQTPAPPPSGGAGGETLPLSAQNTTFSTDALAATADAPFTIEFNNEDVGMPHNVEIKDPGGAQVFLGKIITGPAKEPYPVPPLKAGSYTFVCTVHPNMTGTLTVQ
ncbi:MAG TPA: cytochrome c oxidase subunit II [Candidatus Limnocylindrales bacterium]